MTVLWTLLKETGWMFWNYPSRLLTAAFHHYFGDRSQADAIIRELRSKR
jgi:hypothetical protein